jgi:hypothetical protein
MEQIELYCPYCGGRLTTAKWQYYRNANIVTKICPQNHLWDIWKPPYQEGFEFKPVSLSKCECGEVMPSRDMKEIDKRKVCPKCFEVAKKAWRMDKDKSYARLEITPVQTANGLIYSLNTSIKIEPYPNPFMYGGMWGGDYAKTKEELQQKINQFEKQANELRQNGLERVDIITHDEIVRTEQPKLETITRNKPEPEPKPEVRQLSLGYNPVGEAIEFFSGNEDEEGDDELLQ